MNKNTPFQQHAIETPIGAKVAQKWYRRHLIMDHISKYIFIQVMWDALGNTNLKEYTEISNGGWWNHVPAELIDQVREGISSGYKIKAMVMAGGHIGEMHAVLQIIDIKNERNVMEGDQLTAPVDDKSVM